MISPPRARLPHPCVFWQGWVSPDAASLPDPGFFRAQTANCGTKWNQTFSFDPFGNVNKTATVGTSFNPTYNLATNRIQALSGCTVTYDANGLPLQDCARGGQDGYTWDSEGKAVNIDGVTIVYDALGRGVEVVSGANHEPIVYSPTGEKLAGLVGAALYRGYVPLPGGAKAVYASSGLSFYLHPDWLGSGRLETTPSRTVYQDVAYAPYGENYSQTGATYDLSFTGQTQDELSSTYDFLFRDYSSITGRWYSPDPAGLAAVNPADPQSWNRYAYALNNPLALKDPFGLATCGSDSEGSCVDVVDTFPVVDPVFYDQPPPQPILSYLGWMLGGNGMRFTTFVVRNPRKAANNGFTLGIRAPGQTYKQCLAANSSAYSINDWLPSSWQSGATEFFTGNDVSGALFGDANKGTAGLLVGAGVAAAPIGAGTAGTFGRRTASIFNLNLSGTTGPAPTILGKTGAKEAIGWVSGFFELKLAADIGATAAEALNCIGHR